MAVLTDLFTGIANAIRAKSGNTAAIPATSFAAEISNLAVPQYISGTFTGRSSDNTFTLPNAIGKNNILLMPNSSYTETSSRAGWQTYAIAYINGVWHGTSADLMNARISGEANDRFENCSWNKTTGVLRVDNSLIKINYISSTQEFIYVAW